MTPRSIRRAAERKAMKAARRAERTLAENFQAVESASEALIESETLALPAEDEAAILSEPKIKGVTALTGRTILLPSDDAAEYERHLRAYTEQFQPAGQREADLVQSIADTMWRLKRIPSLEAALFAQGHIEFAEAFNQHKPALRGPMIEAQTFIKYEKQLRNLQLQESRLVRRREKETAELRQLQQEREHKEYEALATASRLYREAKRTNQPFAPHVNGFVFSIEQIEAHLSRVASQTSFGAGPFRPAADTETAIKHAA